MFKVNHSPSFMVEKKEFVIKIATGIHFELNMIKCDHLNMVKSIKDPAQSWKRHSEFLEEDCPDELVGESSSRVLPPELHEGLNVPHVNSKMRSCYGVTLQLKNPHALEGSDLSRPDGDVLAVGVDGDREGSSIGHSTKMSEDQEDVPHIPLIRSSVVSRTAKKSKKEEILMKMDFLKKEEKKKKKLTCSSLEQGEVHEARRMGTAQEAL